MNEFEPSPPVLDIINRVLDGTATESERAQFEQILAKNTQARDLYLRYANLHCTLRLMSGSFVPADENDVSVPKPPSSVPPIPSATSWSASVRWAIICASMAAVVLLAIWAFRVPDRTLDPIQPEIAKHNGDQKVERSRFTLRVVEVHGKLDVIGEDKIVRAAAQGDEISAGATLRSGENGTKAIVELAGERLHLGTDTSIQWMKDDAKPPQIFVAHGDVRVEKVALKTTPAFVLLTPHAEMRGDHGNTDVAVSAKSTRVAVNEGTVQLIRRFDQKRLDIVEGTWVYASADNDPMVPQRPERQAPEVALTVRADRVALAPDGKTMAIFTGAKLEIWDLETKARLRAFDPARKRVTGLSFNPNGDWLIVGDRAPFVQVWDWRNERLVRTLESPQPEELAFRPVFSPDGSKLYCSRHAGVYKGVCGWNTLDWKPLGIPTGKGKVKSFAPIPKTDLFAAGTGDGALILWNSVSDKQQDILRHSKASIQEICASADGRLLAHTGPEGTVVWDLSGRKVRWHFEGNGHLAFSLDGKLLAIASHGYLDFWNSETGQLLSTIRTENDQMQWLHFASDSQTIFALSGAKHRVVTWIIPSEPAF